jgi:hypothetical protein
MEKVSTRDVRGVIGMESRQHQYASTSVPSFGVLVLGWGKIFVVWMRARVGLGLTFMNTGLMRKCDRIICV